MFPILETELRFNEAFISNTATKILSLDFNTYTQRTVLDGPHRESSDIWFRYGDIIAHGTSVLTSEHDSVWYKAIEAVPEIKTIAYEVMRVLKAERLGGVLLTRLEPGCKIYPHVDKDGWHPTYYEKVYIPLKNHDGAKFCFEGLEVQGKPGRGYLFRNDVPHWVNNDSTEVRLALVVCIRRDNGNRC